MAKSSFSWLAGTGLLTGFLWCEMVNLTHWNFAKSFSGEQAAALILGFEPTCRAEMMPIAKPLYDRMESDHVVTWAYYLSEIRNIEMFSMSTDLPATALVCESIKSYLFNIDRDSRPGDEVKASFSSWLINVKEQSDFSFQTFSRAELSRWLNAIGMKSIYMFDHSQAAISQTPCGRWPWGNHHTELLGHLDATARRYWQNYDPTDTTTAPINKDVAEWLVNERKLSQKMAESIASMLRPDGLPTGPRK
jgi:hypothetical protein